MKNYTHKLKFIKKHILLCVLFISLNALSQNEKEICIQHTSNEITNKAFIQNLQKHEQKDSYRNLENDNPVCLPLVLHIVRDSNGTDYLDPIDIPRFVSTVNAYMIAINLKFFVAEIRYIDSDFYSNPNNTSNLNVFDQFEDFNATNIFIREIGGDSGGGLATNSLHLSYSMKAWDLIINHMSLHEFGHYFGLLHTHAFTDVGNAHQYAENVARSGNQSNCDTNGDGFCDTPADNTYSPNNTDIHGVSYEPDETNFMRTGPASKFSLEQINAMQNALNFKLLNTNYDLDGYVQTIFPETPILTQIQSTHLYNELNWSNVSNNLGYIIERSEVSGSSGFKALKLGGTPKDVTSFKDIEIEPNTNYWYRVKAINSCEAYSNINESETENNTVYCYPSNINQCDQLVHLFPDAVTLSDAGNVLFDDANFNCEEYVEVKNYCSINLNSDNEYTINFDMNNYNKVYLNLFLDINIDGDFDVENEWIVINEVLPTRTDHQISFTIPDHLMNEGNTALRLVVNSFQNSLDFSLNNACDYPGLTKTFVQDYCVSLSRGCDVDVYGNFDSTDVDYADGDLCTAFPFSHFNAAWNTPFPWKAIEYYAAYHILLTEDYWNEYNCTEIVNQGTGTDIWMLGSSNPIDTSPAGNESVMAFWAKRKHDESFYTGVYTQLNDLEVGQEYKISFYDSPVSTPGGRQTPNLYYKTKVTLEDTNGIQTEWDGPEAHYYSFSTTAPNTWYAREVTFVATDTSMKLTLSFPLYPDLNNIVNDGYVAIDDIQISCVETTTIIAENNNPESEKILNITLDQMVVYPNPTDGVLYIELQNKVDQIETIEIFNTHGSLLLKEEEIKGNSIDVSNLKKGMYFLKVTLKNKSSFIKNIIKK